MKVIYAAEKPSIAGVLADYLDECVEPADIDVAANPDETGSFLVRWHRAAFVVTPSGDVVPENALD